MTINTIKDIVQDALIGETLDGRPCYDYDDFIQCLMADGMDESEASDFVDFNFVGFQNEHSAVLVRRISR